MIPWQKKEKRMSTCLAKPLGFAIHGALSHSPTAEPASFLVEYHCFLWRD